MPKKASNKSGRKRSVKIAEKKVPVKKSQVEKWQLTVAKKLKEAQQRKLKGNGDHSYGWFKFVRDLLAENNKVVPLALFKKKAMIFYETNNVEEMTKKDFLKDMFAKMDKHPKFNVDVENSCIRWVESKARRDKS